jgi:hypothetical protein
MARVPVTGWGTPAVSGTPFSAHRTEAAGAVLSMGGVEFEGTDPLMPDPHGKICESLKDGERCGAPKAKGTDHCIGHARRLKLL